MDDARPASRHGSAALALAAVLLAGAWASGCGSDRRSAGSLEEVWGRRGLADGRFNKPRSMAIDGQDVLYIVDKTARVQAFDTSGNYLRGWQTPTHENGCPTGLGVDRQGNVIVADTHYYRLLFYSPAGKLLESFGRKGTGPGQFAWVTDAVEDSQGNLYVSEYGDCDRVQKFSPRREFLLQWGGHGDAPGQFARPQDLAVDAQDRIWVADACNHRVQVFDNQGKLLKIWGRQGPGPGELSYPYDLVLDGAGHVYVCEYGNHRVQKFTVEGKSLGCWGTEGRRPGELFNPWAIVRDRRGRIFVLDTNNHRVQRISL